MGFVVAEDRFVSGHIGAMAAGVVSGAGTSTETFKGLDGTTNRVQATVDASGNRTIMTYDP